MKFNLKIIFILALLTTQSAFAKVDLEDYQSTLTEINSLESKGSYVEAALLAQKASIEISQGLGVDGVISSIELAFSEIQNEVVTEKYSFGLGGSILFGLLGIQLGKSWDVARIITANPEGIKQFERDQRRALGKLQQNLVGYIEKNELALVYSKVLAAKALQLTGKMDANSLQTILPLVKKAAAFAGSITFLGSQEVTYCTTTNYADRSALEFLNITGIISFNHKDSKEQKAFTETRCQDQSRLVSVKESDLLLGKLYFADKILQNEAKLLSFREMQTLNAPDYPTWGSSYYNR